MNCFSSVCSVCSVANSDRENNNATGNNSNGRSHHNSSMFQVFEKTLSWNSCVSKQDIKKFKLHHPDVYRYCCCMCIKYNSRKVSPYPDSPVSSIETKGTPIIPIITPPEMYVIFIFVSYIYIYLFTNYYYLKQLYSIFCVKFTKYFK